MPYLPPGNIHEKGYAEISISKFSGFFRFQLKNPFGIALPWIEIFSIHLKTGAHLFPLNF